MHVKAGNVPVAQRKNVTMGIHVRPNYAISKMETAISATMKTTVMMGAYVPQVMSALLESALGKNWNVTTQIPAPTMPVTPKLVVPVCLSPVPAKMAAPAPWAIPV